MTSDTDPQTFCGYVAIVGRPNVGKSTLLNLLLQKKYAVTSKRAQTTRYAMTFILTEPTLNTQFLLVDTPGLLSVEKTDRHFTHRMDQEARHALTHLDLRWWVLEAGRFQKGDEEILSHLKPFAETTVVIWNKVDQVAKDKLLPQMHWLQQQGFNHQFPCSAFDQRTRLPLLKLSAPFLPSNPFFYPADQHVTYSWDFLIREVVREKIMRYVGQEVPYYCHVVCEKSEKIKNHQHLHVRIDVPNERYKTILLGSGGLHMKKIGSAARQTLESLLECPVFLKLWVKVSDGPNALEKEKQQAVMFGWST